MNRAGLYSEYAVIQFGVDHSPPTGGHVIDGLVTNSVRNLTLFTRYRDICKQCRPSSDAAKRGV